MAERAIKAAKPRIEPPEHRKDDSAFCEAWERITGSFEPDYFIAADLEVLENYIALGLEIRATEVLLEREGKTFVSDSTGEIKPHPMLKNLPGMYSAHRGYARMMRLGPATRALSRLAKDAPAPAGEKTTGKGPKSMVIPMAGRR